MAAVEYSIHKPVTHDKSLNVHREIKFFKKCFNKDKILKIFFSNFNIFLLFVHITKTIFFTNDALNQR